jgi:hypothetical protein
MRILNDIACNLNRIQISLIQSKFSWREMKFKLMQKLLKIYSLFSSFVIMVFKMKVVLKKKKSKKHLSIPFRTNSKPKSILIGHNNIRPNNCPI